MIQQKKAWGGMKSDETIKKNPRKVQNHWEQKEFWNMVENMDVLQETGNGRYLCYLKDQGGKREIISLDNETEH